MTKQAKNCCDYNHPNHSKELSRLNRLSGQVDGIKKMIEEHRYCPDIIAQLRAIQSAAKAVESNILRRHLEACVKNAFESNDQSQTDIKIDELINIFKKLD